MAKTVIYTRPDGKRVNGYLVEPSAGSHANGIVVIQEWWGLDDEIKGVAEKLARAGYRALVPDLYRGKLALEANEAQHLMDNLDFGDAAGQDIRGAVRHLKKESAKVAITGFCMGGALTVLASANVPEADASVVWYGYPPLEYVDASRIEMPVLGHWALHDTVFPIAGVDALEQKLRSADVEFEFHRYDAKHAFANQAADRKNLPFLKHDAQAAELAWQRTSAFLAKHLT
jgi:carboxymethylenebutenolidase